MKELKRTQLPSWPALLSEREAAALVGVTPGRFKLEVECGLWPRAAGENPTRWVRSHLVRLVEERGGIAWPWRTVAARLDSEDRDEEYSGDDRSELA